MKETDGARNKKWFKDHPPVGHPAPFAESYRCLSDHELWLMSRLCTDTVRLSAITNHIYVRGEARKRQKESLYA